MSGAVFGEAPLAAFVLKVGWRDAMLTLAAIGAVLSVLMWLIIRDQPKGLQFDAVKEEPKQVNVFKGLKIILSRKQNWLVALYGSLVFAPISAFGALWGVPFLVATHNLSRPLAGTLVSTLFIGFAIGAPLGGWLSDRIGRRKPTLYLASIGAFLTLSAVIYLPHISLTSTAILLFLFGFATSGFMSSFATMREISPPIAAATALGFMNMLNMTGGAIAQPGIGIVLDHFWTGHSIDGSRVYPISAFHIALAILPTILALSFFIVPFIKETRCQPIYKAKERAID